MTRTRFILSAGVMCATLSLAGEPSSVILNGNSPWRSSFSFKFPDVRTADGKLEPRIVLENYDHLKPAPNTNWVALPAAGWAAADFDDSTWTRVRVPIAVSGEWCKTPITYGTALVALRGKFEVKDPAQVQDLRLSLSYFGGAVVFLNGQEVARGHLPAGQPGPEVLAEDYPETAYFKPDGKPLRIGDTKNADRLALRERRIADVKIPTESLRKGVNVLAIAIHRAPAPESILKLHDAERWAPVEPLAVSLSASPAGSVTPNLTRPAGIQVWTCAPVETITVFDFGNPCEPPPVVRISAARNGVFSGRLLVSSGDAIKGLKVSVSDLVQPKGKGTIPASAVLVRCAVPATRDTALRVPSYRFDGLRDEIPAEIPVPAAKPWTSAGGTFWLSPPDRSNVTSGAVASLWLTVRVPRDAAPGPYEGTVSVSADGLTPTTVPVRLAVSAWTVPSPKDFQVINFGQLSPETLARYYAVPLWSDAHLALVAKSMALMAEINSRQVMVDLAINFFGSNKGELAFSNEQTLIRWIRGQKAEVRGQNPEGGAGGSSDTRHPSLDTFTYDFTILDKYLDMTAKAIGKPGQLRLNCWNEAGTKEGKPFTGVLDAGGSIVGEAKNFRVSVLDPASGALSDMEQPTPGTDESLAFWKPVLDEVRKRIEARGWWDVTVMGWSSYCHPPIPHIVSEYHKIWPDGVWAYTAHNGELGAKWKGVEPGVAIPVRNADGVWTAGRTKGGYLDMLKPRPGTFCFTFRGHKDLEDLVMCRRIPEWEITGGHDGYSDFGVDFFPLKKGDRYYAMGNGRGTGGPTDGTLAWLAPGPKGPIATERFEALREGVELAEAYLFIGRALQDKKLSGDLEQRVARCLDERDFAYDRIEGRLGWRNNWVNEDAQLMALAGEVAAASQRGLP